MHGVSNSTGNFETVTPNASFLYKSRKDLAIDAIVQRRRCENRNQDGGGYTTKKPHHCGFLISALSFNFEAVSSARLPPANLERCGEELH
jgi:hypothetical protein